MLEKFIWKNAFLPSFLKKEVISFYENQGNNPYSTTSIPIPLPNSNQKHGLNASIFKNSFPKKSLKQLLIYRLCNKLHKNWFKDNIHEQKHLFKEVEKYVSVVEVPMSFWLLLAKTNKVQKFKKLLDWGLNLKQSFLAKDIEVNFLHQIIWAYYEKMISIEDTKDLIDILIDQKVSLFGIDYKISHYEKALTLLKGNEDFSQHILIKKKKLVELINRWIDNDLYSYLLNSDLNENDKSVLEYFNLKNSVHTIYLENFSGNIRKSGYENINKQIVLIEKIIKRGYLFINQSATYNSLTLLMNLPNFPDLLNPTCIWRCYKEFSNLNNIAKKSLTADLLNKNKEGVLFNLLSYGLNLNWNIQTAQGQNVLGLELLSNTNFVESVMNNSQFQLNISNERGENILHLIDNNSIDDKNIKLQLKNKIEKLTPLQKIFLFNQFNHENLTPMLKALKEQNLIMIDFLSEIGVSGVDEIKGIEPIYASPLNYLKNQIQLNEINIDIQSEIQTETKIENVAVLTQEIEKGNELEKFYKNWNIEKNYLKLSEKFNKKINKNKVIKI